MIDDEHDNEKLSPEFLARVEHLMLELWRANEKFRGHMTRGFDLSDEAIEGMNKRATLPRPQ